MTTKSILLVHGSFHTGECWEIFVPILARHGFDVHTLTLGGHRGNPRDPLTVTMESYGTDVIARVKEIGRPCMLLGHSMGGFVISEAAERRPELFSGLIYLTAFAPRFGTCTMHELAPVGEALVSAIRVEADGTAIVPGDAARAIFYNRCPREVQDHAVQLLCPQPMGATLSAITATEVRLGSVAKHYIECSDDMALPLASQRRMQASMSFGRIETLDTDHSPFLSAPQLLADAVTRIAFG